MADTYEEGDVVSNDKGQKLRVQNGEWVPVVEGPGEINKGLSSVAAIGKGLLDIPSDVVRTGATLSAGVGDLMQGRLPDWGAARDRYSAENNPVVNYLATPGRMLQQGVEAAGGNLSKSYVGELGQAAGEAIGPLSPAAQTSLDVLGVGAGFAAPGAGRAVQQAGVTGAKVVDRVMPNIAGSMSGVNSPMMAIAPGRVANRMADRVTARIGSEVNDLSAGERGLVHPYALRPEWFDESGIPLTNSQRTLLNSSTDADVAVSKRMRWGEDVNDALTEPVAQQRIALNNIVKGELGMAGPEALTRPVLSDIFSREGAKIGELTSASGPIKFDGVDALKAVAKDADTVYKSSLNNIVKDVEASLARNDGHIMPADFQSIRTRLLDMSAPGNEFGKASKAGRMLDELEDALDKTLSDVQRAELRTARYRYKIASAMDTAGAIGDDGFVNPKSFGKSWDKGISKKLRGKDTIGQAAHTMELIHRKEATTGTTLQRIIAQAPGKAAAAAPGAALTALGLSGANAAINQFFGQ